MKSPRVLPTIVVLDTPEDVARAVAERFVKAAGKAVEENGIFSVALSGGSTPKRIYELLAADEFRHRVPWHATHLFFTDERCVPPDHAESNYRMAREVLFSKVDLPKGNVHRMRGELEAVESAKLYEAEMRAFFGDVRFPRFDLMLLGMGDDGHTASLFPHTDALAESSLWVVANPVGKFDAYRLTLSAPAIINAARIAFVVTGTSKAERLDDVLNGSHDPQRLPAQMISPVNGTLDWFLDGAAAAKL
ncbi:MAG: 6-phosphogluconolactonase [Acidobacteriota bacterium]|nr:6-phosphogluconolactonase [Acidobacteriota bacterium]